RSKGETLRGCLKSPDSVIFHRLSSPVPASKQLGRTRGASSTPAEIYLLGRRFKEPEAVLDESSQPILYLRGISAETIAASARRFPGHTSAREAWYAERELQWSCWKRTPEFRRRQAS